MLEEALASLDRMTDAAMINVPYRFIISVVHELIHAFGLFVDVVDPDLFHAIPKFRGEKDLSSW